MRVTWARRAAAQRGDGRASRESVRASGPPMLFYHSFFPSRRARAQRPSAPHGPVERCARSIHTQSLAMASADALPAGGGPPPLTSIIAGQRTRRATPFQHLLIGGGAGVLEVCIMQPTVCVKNALQVRRDRRSSWPPGEDGQAGAGSTPRFDRGTAPLSLSRPLHPPPSPAAPSPGPTRAPCIGAWR